MHPAHTRSTPGAPGPVFRPSGAVGCTPGDTRYTRTFLSWFWRFWIGVDTGRRAWSDVLMAYLSPKKPEHCIVVCCRQKAVYAIEFHYIWRMGISADPSAYCERHARLWLQYPDEPLPCRKEGRTHRIHPGDPVTMVDGKPMQLMIWPLP